MKIFAKAQQAEAIRRTQVRINMKKEFLHNSATRHPLITIK